ncbi:hypothetical protein D3C72_1688880 [compost metagenome]
MLYLSVLVVTCRASSRVGVSTSIFGWAALKRGRSPRARDACISWFGVLPAVLCSALASLCSDGSMKAAVLPEPVCDETSRSRPSIAAGIACDCTAVGAV